MLIVGVIPPIYKIISQTETDIFRGGGGSDWAGRCRFFRNSWTSSANMNESHHTTATAPHAVVGSVCKDTAHMRAGEHATAHNVNLWAV